MRMVITERNYKTLKTGYSGADPVTLSPDPYSERLFKYIPAETVVIFVAAYGVAYALFAAEPWFPFIARWILTAGIVATPLYLWGAVHVTDWVQLAVSTAGFVLWASALGVMPISDIPGFSQIAASLVLPLYITLSPLIGGIPDRW